MMWRDWLYPKSREELHKEYREAIKDIDTHQALADFYSDPEDPHALPHQINWSNPAYWRSIGLKRAAELRRDRIGLHLSRLEREAIEREVGEPTKHNPESQYNPFPKQMFVGHTVEEATLIDALGNTHRYPYLYAPPWEEPGTLHAHNQVFFWPCDTKEDATDLHAPYYGRGGVQPSGRPIVWLPHGYWAWQPTLIETRMVWDYA